MLHSGIEYLSFIVLIGSLFIVAGGIHIRIKGKSKPLSNVALLGVGAVLANFIGTTGASMILIRPYLRVNRYRLRPFHIVIFIFIVSNIGGALTPIGDPPLFLGYLKGIPFFWVLFSVWHIWLLVIGIVLVIFFIIDYYSFKKHEKKEKSAVSEEFDEKAEVKGLTNIFFVGIILLAVFIQEPPFLREIIMIVAAIASYTMTRPEIHRKNEFTFIPIKEVAILFLGIFATMVPALDWLELNSAKIGITTPGQYYWSVGALSSLLDNAPTYLNFLSAAFGLFVTPEIINNVQHLISGGGDALTALTGDNAKAVQQTMAVLMNYYPDQVSSGSITVTQIQVSYLIANGSEYIKAISVGAVFFGAMTYIGNGPNFMVKSIAEHFGCKTPSFGEYIYKYSLPILLPLFIIVWFLFFRG
jgi:Na+/H+ antiporter NhaD/arsenite permease-like protein